MTKTANLLIVFLLCGLWHGAQWTFVFWGLWHGFFLVIERAGIGSWLQRRHGWLRRGYTLLAVILGWVLFRKGQIEAARHELERATQLPDGDDPVIWDHLGDVQYRLGDRAKARAAWQTARRLYAAQRNPAGDDRPAEVERKLKLVIGP